MGWGSLFEKWLEYAVGSFDVVAQPGVRAGPLRGHAIFGSPVFYNTGRFQKSSDLYWSRFQVCF